MKLLIMSFLFMILIAGASLAAGLEITQIDARVDYDEAYAYRLEDRYNRDRTAYATVPIANNSKINIDVFPGSNITFTVRVENTFQGDKPNIKGVFAKMNIEEIDDGADLEEESADFDLEPGNDERVDLKFGVPLNVNAGTYKVVLEAEGEDKNKTSYTTEVNLKLEVKKLSHDIRITKVLLNPSIMDCDRKAKLTAEITNVGSNAENEVALEFKSASLGVNSYNKDIILGSSDDASDEDKKYTKTLNIEVPSFFKAGAYPILVNLYWKNFVLFDQKSVDLIVKDCGSGTIKTGPKQEKNQTEEVVVVKPTEEKPEKQITNQTPQEEVITATEETSFSTPILLSMLLGGFVITILAILIVVGYLKRKEIQ